MNLNSKFTSVHFKNISSHKNSSYGNSCEKKHFKSITFEKSLENMSSRETFQE